MPELVERLRIALAGRYAVERELGHGGMAFVFLAQDLKHQRPVAIKVLRPELAATLGPERFLREIETAARLNHPHILPLHDSGEAGGFLYYVMPYVEGESLRERLDREEQLPVEEALEIARQAAGALAHAHSHDVVHRDVKPENLLLQGDEVLVADFGIARAITAAGGEKFTATGIAVGTPAYMSPEQAGGSQALDGRSDIYSLACVLYEMLAGHPPFTGRTAQEVLARHSLDAVPLLTAARPTVPPALEQVVNRGLAKTPADRFRTASQFADALGGCALAPPSRSRAPGRRWGRVGSVAALIATLAWVASRVLTEARGGRHAHVPEMVQLTFTGNARTPALSPDGQRLAYSIRRCGADGHCPMDVIVQGMDGAGRVTVAQGLADLYDIQWASDGRYLLLNGWPGGDQFGPFSVPSLGGSELRYLGCCRGVIVGRTDTVLVAEQPGGDSAAWLRWVTIADGVTRDSLFTPKRGLGFSADPIAGGQHILKKEWRMAAVLLTVVDRSGRVLDSLSVGLARLRVLQPSPDGRGLLLGRVSAAATDPGDPRTAVPIDLVRYPLGRDGRIGPRSDTVMKGLVAYKESAPILSIARNGTLTYASGPTRSELWLLGPGARVGDVSARRRLATATGYLQGKISPDGRRVGILRGVVLRDRQLKQVSIMSSDSGPETLIGPPQDVVAWGWGPDGSRVLLALREGDSLTIRAVDVPGGASRVVATMEAGETGVIPIYAALQGGGLVVAVHSKTRLRRVGVPGLTDSILNIPAEYLAMFSVSSSPDGRAVAIVGYKHNLDSLLVTRIPLANGRADRVAAFPDEDPADSPAWLPDGSLVVSVRKFQTVVWYRVRPRGGRPVRLGVAPWGTATYSWSADGRRILATVPNDIADVYAIRHFGELLNR